MQTRRGYVRISAPSSKVRTVAVIVVVLVVVVAISLGLGIGLANRSNNTVVQKLTDDAAEEYSKAAVAADAARCSQIGKDVLLKGGSAADGAIAALICCGVYNMHSTGISGGGFLVFYNATSKKASFYNYREAGPGFMTATSYNKNPRLAKVGGQAVGVPGEIRGLREVWKTHGRLKWAELIQPSIDLARNGFEVGPSLGSYLAKSTFKKYVLQDPGLRELLAKPGNIVKETGDQIKDPKVAATLEIVRDNPEDMYTGKLAQMIVDDVKAAGGNITLDDLKNYKVKREDPIKNSLGDLTMYTSQLPGGGPVLTHILNMMKGYKYSAQPLTNEENILYHHRAVESFKFSYGYRPLLGDPDKSLNITELKKNLKEVIDPVYAERDRKRVTDDKTQPNSYYNKFFTTTQDHGTTHVSVLDADGNAVASTDTINYVLGAKFRSTKTGLVYNNELADFFYNGSYPNKYPLPIPNAPGAGKRPLSSTCPTIIVDKDGKVVMVVGASGGTRITLSTAWVIMRKLWFDMELGAAVNDGRPQHSLFPEYIREETKNPLDPYLVEGLKKKGHIVKKTSLFAVVQAIYVDKKSGKIFGKSDARKHGKSAGY